jgi:hypothetical protein
LTTSFKEALNADEELLGSSKWNKARASRAVSTCFRNEVSRGVTEFAGSVAGIVKGNKKDGILREK